MSATLGERLFWPTVVFATLALGGFVYFFAVMFNARPYTSRPPAKAASVASARNAALVVKAAAKPISETEPQMEAQGGGDTSAPSDDIAESGSNGAHSGMAAMVPAEEESPYVVPDHKPFLSRDDFARKPAPKPKRPPVNTPATPAPATASAPMPGALPSAASKSEVLRLLDHRKLVVLGSGREIVAQSIVDLGDSYGIKDDRNQMLTVKKSDVARIGRP